MGKHESLTGARHHALRCIYFGRFHRYLERCASKVTGLSVDRFRHEPDGIHPPVMFVFVFTPDS